MKKLMAFIVISMTFCFSQSALYAKFLGSVNGVDFYSLESHKEMPSHSPFLQKDLENSIKKETQNLQIHYNNFKKSDTKLVVGLDQELKLMVYFFVNCSGSRISRIQVLPRAKNIIDD
ncbi:MAG: hypothetical protein KC505_03880, partial [Myxococcales bacterium]|nr:hypothetical protein [Myxococcales bacterium]